jgi:hypothetical protein
MLSCVPRIPPRAEASTERERGGASSCSARLPGVAFTGRGRPAARCRRRTAFEWWGGSSRDGRKLPLRSCLVGVPSAAGLTGTLTSPTVWRHHDRVVPSRKQQTGSNRRPERLGWAPAKRDASWVRYRVVSALELRFPHGSSLHPTISNSAANSLVGSDTEEDGGSTPPAPTIPG